MNIYFATGGNELVAVHGVALYGPSFPTGNESRQVRRIVLNRGRLTSVLPRGYRDIFLQTHVKLVGVTLGSA